MTKPAIILVKPQMGENIGAAARVMLNFGLKDLRIVTPRDGWPNPKAVDMAAGAKSVIKDAKIFDSLEEAVADLKFLYATTARPRDMVKEVINPYECGELLRSNKPAGVIFGGEKSGLSNSDIVLADKIVSIDVSDEYGSLNLAQSVGVICYEFFSKKSKSAKAKPNVAPKKDINEALKHLEQELEIKGFFKVKEKKKGMLDNINNIFTRAEITKQEAQTIRGIIRSLAKK